MKKLVTNMTSISKKITKPRDHLCFLKTIKLNITIKEIIVISHCNHLKSQLDSHLNIKNIVYVYI